MHITLNGEPYTLTNPISINELLANLDLDSKKVAIEHNMQILPHSFFSSTTITDGDVLEIVHFIGGG
jgi:thiamine biosynthesis protein ThiS